jgi:hypothetical protein
MRFLPLVVALIPAAAFAVASAPIPLMPEALEMELALSAAPAHLRDGATVLRLTDEGYVQARKGDNRFTCLVGRSQPNAVAPMCYDAEGTRTVVKRILDEAAMRARGESEAAIAAAVEAGFRSGKYEAPARPGISYMVSAVQELPGPDGKIRPFVPHLMFYAPNLTDLDIGGRSGGPVFINQPAPHGMIIVPLGVEEQKAVHEEQRVLVERVRAFLDQSTR